MPNGTRDNETLTINRPWTGNDIATLRTNAHLGAAHLATILNRTPNAIALVASRHRISLRPPGEHRGRVLGEQTPGQLPPTIRTRYLTDPRLATKIEADIRTPTALCPLCAQHPQTVTGMCRPCHLAALTEAHRTQDAIERATALLVAARQAKHRAAVERANQITAQDTEPA